MTNQTDSTAKGQIQFIQNYQTALKPGEYKIEVEQLVIINNKIPTIKDENNRETDQPLFKSNLTFFVQGSRFEINPQDIHSVFPPAGSLGDHSHVLPHIVLKTSTLPWERSILKLEQPNISDQDKKEDVPWLALLVLYEEEDNLLKTISKQDFLQIVLSKENLEKITLDNSNLIDLWHYLLRPEILWLQIKNDKVSIVSKNNRKSPNFSDNFSGLEYKIDEIFDSHDINMANIKEKIDEISKKIKLWTKLFDSEINWLTVISSDKTKNEAKIVDKNSGQKTILEGDFFGLEEQVEAIFAQVKNTKVVPLKNLSQNYTNIVKWNAIKVENGQHEDDNVSVIDINKKFLSEILPTTQDLEYLAHVRQVNEFDVKLQSINSIDDLPTKDKSIVFVGKIDNSYYVRIFDNTGSIVIDKSFQPNQSKQEIDNNLDKNLIKTVTKAQLIEHLSFDLDYKIANDPLAVIISNRLCKKKGRSTAYLVSLEERFNEQGEFNYENANDTDYIRLVTLKSWSFSCSEPEQNFQGLLKNLNSNLLRLPQNANIEAEKYLAKGYVPLPHNLRQGGKTFSWYHSPLLPGKNPTDLTLSQLSIRCADQLIAYDYNNGLFDISYAAAWQLGQLLALQDKKFAVSLFNWKRTNAQNLAKDNQQALYPHFFAKNNENRDKNGEFPEDVKTWLERLGLLYNIPFNYLVPDETMLPIESIRFFWLDWFWIESLLDGAFSVGGVQESNVQEKPIAGEAKVITGFLMRSEVVSGWPDLQIDGSSSLINDDSSMEGKLDVLRCDRLSEDVLICLFDGEIKTVDISLKPEGLHFGFNKDEETMFRELRQLNGIERSDWKIEDISLDSSKSVINISELTDKIKIKLKENQEQVSSFTSAEFALQMVQGAEKVRFLSTK